MLAKTETFFGAFSTNFGLLLLRVGIGGLMLGAHGWGKFMTFGEKMESFPDPLGVSPPVSLLLVVGAEFFCAGLVVVGAFTRLACIPLMVTMLVAIFIIHAEDPWARQEFAALYLIPFLALFFTGAGSFSVDRLMLKRRR